MSDFLDELDRLTVDDYRSFPFQNEESAWGLDRYAFLMKDESAKLQICTEAQQKLYQMGPQGFRMQVLFGMLQSLSHVDEDGSPKITAEAVVAFHLAELQFECVRPF